MPVWNKLKQELDRAGQVAQGALDEGRLRLDIFRARQQADKAAQALGYALYRARQQGRDIEPDSYARLSSALAAHEADIARLDELIRGMSKARRERRWGPRPGAPPSTPGGAESPPPSSPPPS